MDSYFLGEIRAFAFAAVPSGWLPCDGSLLSTRQYGALYQVIGNTFGGSQDTFGVPDLRGRAAVAAGQGQGLSAYALGAKAGQEKVALTLKQIQGHTHSPTGTVRVSTKPGNTSSPAGAYPAVSTSNQYGEYTRSEMGADSVKGVGNTVGNNEGHENRQPFLTLTYAIATQGLEQVEAYTGEIRLYGGKTPPEDWRFCDGSLLNIQEYPALYTLIGTTYGGDGQVQFALPNMASRIVVGKGHAPGLTDYSLGQQLGTETVALGPLQVPNHQHPITGNVQVITNTTSPTASPEAAYFADKGVSAYSTAAGPETLTSVAMNGTMQPAGGGGDPHGSAQPHANVQPVQAINYIICLNGIYPSHG